MHCPRCQAEIRQGAPLDMGPSRVRGAESGEALGEDPAGTAAPEAAEAPHVEAKANGACH